MVLSQGYASNRRVLKARLTLGHFFIFNIVDFEAISTLHWRHYGTVFGVTDSRSLHRTHCIVVSIASPRFACVCLVKSNLTPRGSSMGGCDS